MKRLTTIFLIFLFALTLQGQKIITYQGDVNIVTNGGFDADSDWDKQASWTISGGKAHYDALTDVNYIGQSLVITVDKRYRIRFDISNAGGNAILAFTNQAGAEIGAGGFINYTNSSQTIIFTCSVAATELRIYARTSGVAFSIDNISCEEWYPDGRVIRAYDANQPLNVDETCEVWLDGKDASTFSLSGTSVDQWDDKSGNDRHCNNTNADATRPTWDSSTGRVTFTSANSTFLQSAAFGSALSQPNTVFIVYKLTGALNTSQLIFSSQDGSSSHNIFTQSSIFRIRSATILTDGATNANDNIHVGLFNGVSGEYWINGISVASGDVGVGTLNGINLGRFDATTWKADCQIMEVIVYGVDISDVSRDKITAYLADKWSITATTDFKGYILRQDYCIESNRIFAAMGTQPDADRKRLIDNFVRSSIANGVWAKLDFLYILASHAENSSLLNWINPGTFDATNVHSTAFEVDRGYTGDGANDYLNSNYNPNTDGINYLQDDASVGVYVITNVVEGRADIGAASVGNANMIRLYTTNPLYYTINTDSQGSVANTDTRGFWIISRLAAASHQLYRNSSQIKTENDASTGLTSKDIYILSFNDNGVAALFSTKQISAAFAGGGMTQTNVDNFTDRIEAFMDALGAGVISECMWLILLLIPNVRRREEEFKIAA